MLYDKQYLVSKEDGFLKENGKITSTIERAYIAPTKKLAQKCIDKYGGEIKTVYVCLNKPVYASPLESVWLIKRICQVNGLSIYGPFFSLKEAEEIYNSELVKSKNFTLLEFTENNINLSNGTIRYASNRLRDEISLCRINKVNTRSYWNV
jgi:hypothetical protein